MNGSALRNPTGTRPNAATPIDFAYLTGQTLGDRDLERELLALFDHQAGQIAARLEREAEAGDRSWRRDLSHKLAGSAKAIGALRVAEAASLYEKALLSSAVGREVAALRHALTAEIAAAREAISLFLAEV